MEDRNRFRILAMRGGEFRLERAAALYEFYQHIESVRGVLGQTPATRRFLDLAIDFIRALAESDGLEVYMGQTSTDAYGVAADAEVLREGVRFGLKWSRDTPPRRIFVECSLEEAVAIAVAVDLQRSSGQALCAGDLSTVIPPRVWGRVVEEVDEAADSAADQEQLLEAQARALDAQSIIRFLVWQAVADKLPPFKAD